MGLAGSEDRGERAFVAQAFLRGHAAAVRGTQREGRDCDGVGLRPFHEHVFLAEHEASLHAASFPDVELRRPVALVGELIPAEPERGHLPANPFRHGFVGRQEAVELEGVLPVLLQDLRPGGRVGRAPAVRAADQSHREEGAGRVADVELAAGQRVQFPGQALVAGCLEEATDQLEARRIVVGRRREGHAVRGVLGHAETETVDHHAALGLGVDPGVDRTDQRQGDAVRIEGFESKPWGAVLAAGEAFVVFRAAFAAERPIDAGGGHQVAFVGRVDEDLGGERSLLGDQMGQPAAFGLGRDQPLLGQHADACLLEHRLGHAGGHVGFVGPDRAVIRVHGEGRPEAAGRVVRRDAAVPFPEKPA